MTTYLIEGEFSFNRGLTDKEAEILSPYMKGLCPDGYNWSKDHSHLELNFGQWYSRDIDLFVSTITEIVKASDTLSAEGYALYEGEDDGNVRLTLTDQGKDYEYLSGDELVIWEADTQELLNELLRRNTDNEEAFHLLSLAANVAK